MKRYIIIVFIFVSIICSFIISDCNSFTMPGFDILTLGDVYGPRNVNNTYDWHNGLDFPTGNNHKIVKWQIELFFKWIKQHFTVKHFYGTSQSAVENQIFIALEAYCLLLLLKLKTGYQKTLLDLTRILKVSLYKPFTTFV